ncbi:fimbrial protein [Serratia sp. OS31]|uniref:fimbrial protein n=1 Tax=Serratia sp. OS31 TaxID=2760844 RepID=UPI00160225AE|nr:fimbrial protein [Serratia sp. OS31]MBB1585005.1 type 1 fimbrial protein [Serratia sp. OS31]
MNKNLALFLCLSLPALMLMVVPARAETVLLNFEGSISQAGCSVRDAATEPPVILGRWGTNQFAGDGMSPPVPFTLKLNCPDAKQATITFSGTADSNDNTLLKIDGGTGVASGVGIRIEDSNRNPINLASPSAMMTLASGNNDLQFFARYKATTSPAVVSVGAANATAQFTLNYQ